MFEIAVTKAKDTLQVDSDVDLADEEVYKWCLQEGIKAYINRGMTKITKANYPDPEKLKEAALEVAMQNLEDLKAGKLPRRGRATKESKVPGVVMTEARRLARNLIKDEMKRQGIKVSHVEASEITKAANQLLEADDSLIKQAEANLAERAKTPIKVDVKALIKESPIKVAAAEAKKAKQKAATSAKQAAMVQTRGRVQPTQRAH
jgi:hypothetical protein